MKTTFYWDGNKVLAEAEIFHGYPTLIDIMVIDDNDKLVRLSENDLNELEEIALEKFDELLIEEL